MIGGWGGGPQFPPVMRGLDRALPADIVFSCLNPGQGTQPHVPVLAEIAKHRPVWGMPWLEGDNWLWLLQPRVSMMFDNVKAAKNDGLSGAVAIHWRTEEPRANFEAFARAAQDPAHAPSVEDFYREDCTAPVWAAVAARIDAAANPHGLRAMAGRHGTPRSSSPMNPAGAACRPNWRRNFATRSH